jgi:exopolysaccharide biosynthesis polyprenyl glycosylphosphotransferase
MLSSNPDICGNVIHYLDAGMIKNEQCCRSALPYVVADLCAVVVAYYATLMVRFHSDWGAHFFAWVNVALGVRDTAEVGEILNVFYYDHAFRILSILGVTLVFLYAFMDLYESRRFIRRRYQARNLILANLVALFIFYAYFYLTRNDFHPRSVFATLLGLNVVLALVFRWSLSRILAGSGLIRCKAIVLGNGSEAQFIERYIQARRPHGIEVAAAVVVGPDETMPDLLERIKDLIRRHDTRMLICADLKLTVVQIMQILEMSEGLKQEVKVLSGHLGVLVNEAEMAADFFLDYPLVHFAVPPGERAISLRVRLAVMRGIAAVLLVMSSPLLLVVAVVIRMSGQGSIFFTQERIGFNRKPFRMLKFRTMHDRADELLAQVEEFNESGEGLFKIRRDPRVTPVGRFLRRFSLDEMPQLINVLRGEMTLVGPRPLPRRDFENYYEEWHYGRHSGLPGLTCLWQVSGRSDVSFHNMCILDDYYLRNQNAMLDLKLLLRTVGVVLFAKGAY